MTVVPCPGNVLAASGETETSVKVASIHANRSLTSPLPGRCASRAAFSGSARGCSIGVVTAGSSRRSRACSGTPGTCSAGTRRDSSANPCGRPGSLSTSSAGPPANTWPLAISHALQLQSSRKPHHSPDQPDAGTTVRLTRLHRSSRSCQLPVGRAVGAGQRRFHLAKCEGRHDTDAACRKQMPRHSRRYGGAATKRLMRQPRRRAVLGTPARC